MDFIDEVKAIAAKTPGLLQHIKNEAAVRTALVEPFIRALGYDTSNPAEVVPEFGANVKISGVKQDEHVDYAVMKDSKPIIFIEVKPQDQDPNKGYKQLYDYFARFPEARIAIATFDIDGMVTSANELKFVGGIFNILTQQVASTDEEFAEYFFRQLCQGERFVGGIKQQFATYYTKGT
jgi:hypothetical protein